MAREEFLLQVQKLEGLENASDVEMIRWATDLKEVGNGYYKNGDFISATLAYETVLDVIVPNLPLDEAQYLQFHKLVVSCFLNMAACYMKLDDYRQTISICTHVIKLDQFNPKGFYRRGQAYAKIGEFDDALSDLEEAHKLEPKNKDILFELHKLKDERVTGLSVDANSYGKGKSISHPSLHGSFVEEGCSSTSSVAGGENGKLGNASSEQLESLGGCIDFQSPKSISCENKFEVLGDMEESVEVVMPDVGVIDEDDENNIRDTVSSCENISDVRKFKFVNRKNTTTFLHLSSSNMKVLMEGKELQFYNPLKMSLMKVKVVAPKNLRSGEAREKDCSRSTTSCVDSLSLGFEVENANDASANSSFAASQVSSQVSSMAVEGMPSIEPSSDGGNSSDGSPRFQCCPFVFSARKKPRVSKPVVSSFRSAPNMDLRRSTRQMTFTGNSRGNNSTCFHNSYLFCRSIVGSKRKAMSMLNFEASPTMRKKKKPFVPILSQDSGDFSCSSITCCHLEVCVGGVDSCC